MGHDGDEDSEQLNFSGYIIVPLSCSLHNKSYSGAIGVRGICGADAGERNTMNL